MSSEQHGGVKEIARKLAAHGGGAVSLDLAFDLVLHEVVEQARDSTGATGAAIALIREGEMVCRATSGENAPDLGVRVETASGLAGVCVNTGKMQHCRDTEIDSRANAEACRQLSVRSMLIAPLIDQEKVFGILQVFSSLPNAFSDREVDALKFLAQRIAESKKEADAGATSAPRARDRSLLPSETTENLDRESSSDQSGSRKVTEIASSILFLLVIAAAVLLGIVIGWRGAVKGQMFGSQPHPVAGSAGSRSAQNLEPAPMSSAAAYSEEAPITKPLTAGNSAGTQVGGLVVTQDGKVIYRSPESSSNRGLAHPAHEQHTTQLIHRVDPEYPPDARAQHIQGAVVLDVQIQGSGEVRETVVVSGNPLLAAAAVRAVKQWHYQPSFDSGQAVESQTRITIRFTLPPI